MINLLNIWKKYIKPNTLFVVIEVFTEHSKEKFTLITIQSKKSQLRIKERHTLNSLEEVVEKTSKHKSLIWIFNTDNIIHYKTTKNTDIGLIPEFNHEAFYAYENGDCLILCKKEKLDLFFERVKNINLVVSSVYIGIESALKFLPLLPSQFNLKLMKIETENDQLVSLKKDTQNNATTYLFGDYEVESSHLLSFIAAVDYYANFLKDYSKVTFPKNKLSIPLESLKKLQHKIKTKHLNTLFYKQTLKKIILLFVGLLFLNFAFYISFSHATNKIKKNQLYEISKKLNLEKAKEALSTSERKFIRYKLQEENQIATRIDEIVSSLPNLLLLSSFTFQPFQNNTQEDNSPSIKKNTIYCSGNSPNQTLLNEWMLELKKIDWVESIRIENYGKKEDLKFHFSFEIKIK